jgi:hypothetical protein
VGDLSPLPRIRWPLLAHSGGVWFNPSDSRTKGHWKHLRAQAQRGPSRKDDLVVLIWGAHFPKINPSHTPDAFLRSAFAPYVEWWCDHHESWLGTPAPRVGSTRARKGAARPSAFPPMVFSSLNEQCAPKKLPQYRSQAKLLSAANRAARLASRAARVPYLDLSAMMSTASDVCEASGDGLHVKHWVDHVRVQRLLSLICDEAGHFIGLPVGRFLHGFNRTAVRCG